jgi:phosphonate transport system substrate-binding protein
MRAHTPGCSPSRAHLAQPWRPLALLLAWMALCTVAALWPARARAQSASGWAPAPGPPAHYTVAVVPQFPAVDINRVWSPVLAHLSRELGVQLTLKVAKDIPSFEAEVMAGEPDFAYLNPYHQWAAHRAQGYVPLVRDTQLLTGLLVVRKDSTLQTPQGLQDQTVAFPAPNAFGASLLVRALLTDKEHVRFTPMYARTHTNAFRQVVLGKAAAAGGLRATLAREPDELRQQLRVLLETPGAAPHPLSAHPRVPAALQAALIQAWMKLPQEPTMQPWLQDIPRPHPMQADHERDYAPLARLHLDHYVE